MFAKCFRQTKRFETQPCVCIFGTFPPSVFLSVHPPLCFRSPTSCHLSIRAASSANLVASRSQTSAQCLTVRYVPASLSSREGVVSPFHQPAALLLLLSALVLLSATPCLSARLFGNESVSWRFFFIPAGGAAVMFTSMSLQCQVAPVLDGLVHCGRGMWIESSSPGIFSGFTLAFRVLYQNTLFNFFKSDFILTCLCNHCVSLLE